MPLPKVSQEDIAEVEEQEQQAAREAAVAEVAAPLAEPVAVAEVAVKGKAEVAVSQEAYDPMAFLAELGITDIQIDHTSFPTITLDKGNFVTSGASIGQDFEAVYMDKRRTFLVRGQDPADRDADTLLCYTDDMKTANNDGRLVSEHVAEWEKKIPGIKVDDTSYYIVMVKMVGGDNDGELAQLQVSKTSMGRLDGHLVSLAMNRINPKAVVTRFEVGPLLGSGKTTWNVWDFKKT